MGNDDTACIDIAELKRLADIAGTALQQGMVVEAETIFAAIVPFCPVPSTGPLIGLAMTRHGQGDSEAGIAILQDQALAQVPDCQDTLSHLAMILRYTGRFEEAAACIARARARPVDESLEVLLDKVESGQLDDPLRWS